MDFPKPLLIDSTDNPVLRWGIIGPGEIAKVWTSAVQRFTNQRVVAVASTSPERGQAFATELGIPKFYTSYKDLVSDPDIEAVYIASWQGSHFEHGMLCVEYGKPFLVEKPITYTASQAKHLLEAARSKGLLVMEAMWTRYLPQASVIDQILAGGELGKPELLTACFATDNRSIPRLWTKGGGGVVHDMGIYPIALAQQFLGDPIEIRASGKLSESGIDAEAFVELRYESGARASLVMSAIASLPQTVHCSFENAVLNIEAPFLAPSTLTLTGKEFYPESSSWNDRSQIQGHDGLCYPAVAFSSYLSRGLLESPVRSHADTISCIAVAEEIVRQLGATPY